MYAEGDDVCRNVVGRNYNWNLLHLLHRERVNSGMYFDVPVALELALKILKRITLLLSGFSFLFVCLFLKMGYYTKM